MSKQRDTEDEVKGRPEAQTGSQAEREAGDATGESEELGLSARSVGTPLIHPEDPEARTGEMSEDSSWSLSGTDSERVAPREEVEREHRAHLKMTGGGAINEYDRMADHETKDAVQNGPRRR